MLGIASRSRLQLAEDRQTLRRARRLQRGLIEPFSSRQGITAADFPASGVSCQAAVRRVM